MKLRLNGTALRVLRSSLLSSKRRLKTNMVFSRSMAHDAPSVSSMSRKRLREKKIYDVNFSPSTHTSVIDINKVEAEEVNTKRMSHYVSLSDRVRDFEEQAIIISKSSKAISDAECQKLFMGAKNTRAILLAMMVTEDEELPRRVHNAYIDACVAAGEPQEAEKAMLYMLEDGIYPDPQTMSKLLRVLLNRDVGKGKHSLTLVDVERTKLWIDRFRKLGLHPSWRDSEAILNCFLKLGEGKLADEQILAMGAWGKERSLSHTNLELLIKAQASFGMLDSGRASHLLNCLEFRAGKERAAIIAVREYVEAGLYDKGFLWAKRLQSLESKAEMQKIDPKNISQESRRYDQNQSHTSRSFWISTNVLNKLLKGLLEAGRKGDAQALFHGMATTRAKPNANTFRLMLEGWMRGKALRGHWVEKFLSSPHLPDVPKNAKLAFIYARAGDPKKALQFLHKYRSDRMARAFNDDQDSFKDEKYSQRREHLPYAALVEAFAKNGDLSSAEDCFSIMKEDGIEPTIHTFLALFSVCSQLGVAERLRHWVDAARKSSVSSQLSDEGSINSLIKAQAEVNDIENTLYTIQLALEQNVKIRRSTVVSLTKLRERVEDEGTKRLLSAVSECETTTNIEGLEKL